MFVDESGFSLIPYVGKTWAPIGQTPVLVHQGRWSKFSAIGGVTPTGHLCFRVHESSIRGPKVVTFLRHLLRPIRRRPIMVFGDGGPHHRAKVARTPLATPPRLGVHRFPGYSPELNPDAYESSASGNGIDMRPRRGFEGSDDCAFYKVPPSLEKFPAPQTPICV